MKTLAVWLKIKHEIRDWSNIAHNIVYDRDCAHTKAMLYGGALLYTIVIAHILNQCFMGARWGCALALSLTLTR